MFQSWPRGYFFRYNCAALCWHANKRLFSEDRVYGVWTKTHTYGRSTIISVHLVEATWWGRAVQKHQQCHGGLLSKQGSYVAFSSRIVVIVCSQEFRQCVFGSWSPSADWCIFYCRPRTSLFILLLASSVLLSLVMPKRRATTVRWRRKRTLVIVLQKAFTFLLLLPSKAFR